MDTSLIQISTTLRCSRRHVRRRRRGQTSRRAVAFVARTLSERHRGR